MVPLLVGAAMAFKTVVSLSHAPVAMAPFVLGRSSTPLILFFLIALLFFVVSSISGGRIEAISRGILPFLAVQAVVIFLITFISACR